MQHSPNLFCFLLFPFFLTRMDAPGGDLAGKCSGQLVTSGLKPGHIRCDGIHLGWIVETLMVEMEVCPMARCGGCFVILLLNLRHQDSHHRGVVAKLCGVCRGTYISEGAFIRHVEHGHGGPSKFDQELEQA